MSSILIIDDDTALRELFTFALKRAGYEVESAAGSKQGLELAASGKFDLVVLDVMMPDMDGYEVCRRLRETPGLKALKILILTARSQPVDLQMAMQSGADAYMAKPTEPNELKQKIAGLLAAAPKEETAAPTPGRDAPATSPRPAGRILPVVSLRGGVGRTTVAVNLAAVFAQQRRKACLMDLARGSGHVSLHLRLRPGPGWNDLPPDAPEKGLAKVLQRHASGVAVLPAPALPQTDGLSPDMLGKLLDALTGYFDEVLLDLPPLFDESLLTILRRARPALLLLTPEPGAIQTALVTLQALKANGLADERVSLVLNQVAPEGALPVEKVQQALGRPLLASLPYDPAQPEAVLQGGPIVIVRPDSPLARAVGVLAGKIVH